MTYNLERREYFVFQNIDTQIRGVIENFTDALLEVSRVKVRVFPFCEWVLVHKYCFVFRTQYLILRNVMDSPSFLSVESQHFFLISL